MYRFNIIADDIRNVMEVMNYQLSCINGSHDSLCLTKSRTRLENWKRD